MTTDIQGIKDQAQQSIVESMGVKPKQGDTLTMVKGLLNNEELKKRFNAILGEKSAAFMSSVMSLVSSRTDFAGVEGNSIMASALVAASLDLSINPAFGYAHIVPFNDKKAGKKVAQFQIGYKGLVQLAHRTAQYAQMNVTEVYEGELVSNNRFAGVTVFDESKRKSDKIIGYYAYFKLLNGFEKSRYMSREEVLLHAKKYSKSFTSEYGKWQLDFDVMAQKTVLKLLLTKWGILSIAMEKAISADQSVVKETADGNLKFEYIDNPETPYEEVPEANGNSAKTEELPQTETTIPLEAEKPQEQPEKELTDDMPAYYENLLNNIKDAADAAKFKRDELPKLTMFSGETAKGLFDKWQAVAKKHKIKA